MKMANGVEKQKFKEKAKSFFYCKKKQKQPTEQTANVVKYGKKPSRPPWEIEQS